MPSRPQTKEDEENFNKQRSKKTQKKYDVRKKTAKVEAALEEQFGQGRVLGTWTHTWHIHLSTYTSQHIHLTLHTPHTAHTQHIPKVEAALKEQLVQGRVLGMWIPCAFMAHTAHTHGTYKPHTRHIHASNSLGANLILKCPRTRPQYLSEQ